MTKISCKWRDVRFSRFQRGAIVSVSGKAPERIYRDRWTGQIRIYSPENFDGEPVEVDGGPAVTMRARGRFGQLYISE